jgi:hypothetical protein
MKHQSATIHIILCTFAAASLVLTACAPAPTATSPPCRTERGDCTPASVKTRVLAAFPQVAVAEVLECVSEPSYTCYSTSPDEEACLVRPGPGALNASSTISGSSRTPSAVVGFMRKTQKSFRMVSVHNPQARRQHLIYSDQDGSLAILLITERRCFNVEEVI